MIRPMAEPRRLLQIGRPVQRPLHRPSDGSGRSLNPLIWSKVGSSFFLRELRATPRSGAEFEQIETDSFQTVAVYKMRSVVRA